MIKLKSILTKEPKTLFLGLLAIYFLTIMHYFQHNYGGSGLDLPINPLGWIVISCLIGLGLIQIIRTQTFIFNRYLIILSSCCGLLLTPLLYSGAEAIHSYSRLFGLFTGLLVLVAFYQMQFNDADRRKVLWCILIAAFLESLFALAQFYVLPHITFLHMNIARPSAIFFQANVAATFFATGLMISLYLSHSLPKHANKLTRIILIVAPLTLIMSIVLLQSRTGFLGCIIGVIIWLCVYRSIPKKWLLMVVTGIVIAISSMSLLSSAIRDANIYTQDSARTIIYGDSLNAIKRAPLLGHGYGSFGYTFREQQALNFQENSDSSQIYNLNHPHNELLLWGVEGGLISLIPLFIILLSSTMLFKRNIKAPNVKVAHIKALGLLAIIFPISLHLFTEYPFYHSVASYLTFLLLLGLIATVNTQSKTLKFNNPKFIYGLIGLSIIANTFVMLNLLSGQNMLTQSIRDQKIDNILDSDYFFMSADFELVLNEAILNLAISHNIPVGATAYNNWVTTRIQSYPRKRHFVSLYKSYQYLQKDTLAKQTLNKAKYLFPTFDWSFDEDGNLKRPKKILHKNLSISHDNK